MGALGRDSELGKKQHEILQGLHGAKATDATHIPNIAALEY